MTDIAKKASSALEEREPVWQYADAPESTDIVKLDKRYGLFIGGEFVEPKSGKWFATINPATEEKLAEVADAGPEDVDLAVRTARKASKERWRKLPGRARAKYSAIAASFRKTATAASTFASSRSATSTKWVTTCRTSRRSAASQ